MDAPSAEPAGGAGSPGIADRIAGIRDRIAAAERAAGRAPGSVTLMAVSKGQPAAAVLAALRCGLFAFGENYAQELLAKDRDLRALTASGGAGETDALTAAIATWHYQGALQRRKVRDLLPVVASFHAVARREELDEIAKRASAATDCYLEVNIGSEPQKNGVLPGDLPGLLDHAARLDRVRVRGLMTVPPEGDEPARWFAALRELAGRHGLAELSMGMSSDFEAAIREGATIVRVGTALFGPRPARVGPA